MSNEKKGHWLFRVLWGDEILTSHVGMASLKTTTLEYIRYIRIPGFPIKQPVFHGKYPAGALFERGSYGGELSTEGMLKQNFKKKVTFTSSASCSRHMTLWEVYKQLN